MDGLLLINTGTPDAAETAQVSRYLKQFLMDPLVLDTPFIVRWPLVHLGIVPRRAPLSAGQYKKIWGTDSPLRENMKGLSESVQRELEGTYRVRFAMRYGNPSIESQIRAFAEEGMERLVAFPLYPQFSLASTESAVRETKRVLKKWPRGMGLRFIPPFYEKEEFLDAFAQSARAILAQTKPDRVLFSFHGVPEKMIRRSDPSGDYCFRKANCCDTLTEENKNCYRAQCFFTALKLAPKLGIDQSQYHVCFQSRLGRTPWIRPFTDELYRELPKQGVRNLVVLCPSFVSDCLETLEEVAIRGEREFVLNGGEKLTLAPCPNASAGWAKGVARLVEHQSPST